jgi:hypothetical protein
MLIHLAELGGISIYVVQVARRMVGIHLTTLHFVAGHNDHDEIADISQPTTTLGIVGRHYCAECRYCDFSVLANL